MESGDCGGGGGGGILMLPSCGRIQISDWSILFVLFFVLFYFFCDAHLFCLQTSRGVNGCVEQASLSLPAVSVSLWASVTCTRTLCVSVIYLTFIVWRRIYANLSFFVSTLLNSPWFIDTHTHITSKYPTCRLHFTRLVVTVLILIYYKLINFIYVIESNATESALRMMLNRKKG